MALPTDSAHLSDQVSSEMIEDYSGAVDSQFAADSIMRKFVEVSPLRGTDTRIVRRIGTTELQALVPGVRPDATPRNYGRAAVTVDTVILARDNRSMLNEFQTDFNARKEIGIDHGKLQAHFFDQALIIQAIKGAGMSAPSDLGGAFGAGRNSTLSSAGDEMIADELYKAIAAHIVAMQEDDIDTSEMVCLLRPTQEDVLANHDKLVNKDYSSANGDFAMGKVNHIKNVPIFATPRIPNAAITGHKLSNTANSNAYDVSSTEAKTVAVIMHPKSLLASETIPLSSDVFFSKSEKQWFIDSFTAFGASVRRPDVCAVVRKA